MALTVHDFLLPPSDAPARNNVYPAVNPEFSAAILQSSASLSGSDAEEIHADHERWQVLLTLGIFVLFPVSMLLILGGAISAGALAAACFTASQRRIRRVHRIRVIIEPDAKPELLEKIG